MFRNSTLPSVFPMEVCIPSNDLLWGPMSPIFTQLTGALGAFVVPLTILMLVGLVIVAVVTIKSKSASNTIKAIVTLVALGLAAPLMVLLYVSAYTLMNNAC